MAHRYYCPPQNIAADKASLTFTGDEAAHLARVLRAKPGQRITAFDGAGMRYACSIETVAPDAVVCTVEAAVPGDAEPDVEVTLYAGYPKSDKLELIIQKAVELGAVRIVPFFSKFCVTAPKKEEQKNQRYARIALEAAKQAGRDFIPDVAMPLAFNEMLKELADFDAALFCYEATAGGPTLRECCAAARAAAAGRAPRIAIITGPEGGFDAAEAQAAAAAGAQIVGLGPRILRCETAPIAALAAVMALTENLE